MTRTLTHVIGFDDAPFERDHRSNVRIVGAVFSGPRLEGVLSGRVRRDGVNATRVLATLVRESRFYPQLHAVLLQGIALGGFNVVDLHALQGALGLPVVVIARRRPDLTAIRHALCTRVPGGPRKWRLIERAGPMERIGMLYVQYAGAGRPQVEALLARSCLHSTVPEPLRVAHLIAGGIELGQSSGRV